MLMPFGGIGFGGGVVSGGQCRKMLLGLPIDFAACTLKQRLVEVAVADFAGQIADGRKLTSGDRYDPIEKISEGFAGASGQLGRALQAAFQHGKNREGLLLHPLMRFVYPQHGLFQFGSAVQRVNPVMFQSAAESIAERQWKAFPLPFQHAQVREEVRFGAGCFSAIQALDLWLASKERADIGKNLEDLVLQPPDLFAIAM